MGKKIKKIGVILDPSVKRPYLFKACFSYLWTYPVQMILSPSTMTPLTPPCLDEEVEIQDQINFPV